MLTPEEIVDCRTDLLTFTKTVFKAIKGVDFIENWHHVEMCNKLELVVIGDIQRLIINIPPRYSKTELAVVNFIAWGLGNFPDSEFLHLAYGSRLAEGNTFNVKKILESDIYRQIFPDFQLRKDSTAKGMFTTIEGGQVYADSAGGTVTGKGAGKLSDDGIFHGAMIIDDPIKPDDARSEVVREGVNTNYTETLISRTNNHDTPIIVIMQRLHENDLSGFLLNGGSGEEWEHLVIPCWDENKKPLWEFKHSSERLETLKKANPYGFAGQMEQRPAPIGGGIFKDSYWNFYKVLPVITSKRLYADTAMKAKEENDYSVFQCWGKSKAGQIYLLDQVRGKWEAPELIMQAKAFYNKHNVGYAHVNAFKIEDKASGTGLIQTLKREGMPIVAIPRDTDKVSRANDCVGLLESGNVYLPEDAPWLSDYLSEFSLFPNAKNDDQVDPTMDAIEDFLRNDTINYAEMFK
ncbi:MAG: phage terminase large subunit [Deltaproteobacteria bacterium]|nr:phage terminase large subunit [Deltaproteobacteria bacterium]